MTAVESGVVLATAGQASEAEQRADSKWRAGLSSGVVRLVSLGVLLLFWSLAGVMLGDRVFPGPHLVLAQLWSDMTDGSIWKPFGVTMLNTVIAFLVAMVASTIIGIALGRSRRLERFFETWIVILMTMPAVVTIILVYMIFGLNQLSAIIAAVIIPLGTLTTNMIGGVKAIDMQLVDMSKIFGASRAERVRYVILPQVIPTVASSARIGFAFVWKMILFVELVGGTAGIGYQISFYYSMMNMTQVLAYSVLALVAMVIIEVAVFGWAERRLLRWRPKEVGA